MMAVMEPPPPLPHVSSGEVEWEVAASFATVGQWHRANRILSRHGIIARMRMGTGDDTEVHLLVLQTEVEWARDLIGRVDELPGTLRQRGFPLDESAVIAPAGADELRAIPVQSEGLSESQRGRYTVAIIVLWVIFAIILALVFLSFMAA